MGYSILFVVALILVSGFIAYFGDILGRRMGKKRLSLFNLRPRYTAIVVTTITGMIISALALAALISVNSQFRRVLTEGERIFTQNKRLTTDNATLAQSNRLLTERRNELVKRVEERQKQLEVAKAQVAKAERAVKAAQQSVARLKADIETRKRDIEMLSARKFAADVELEKRNEELAGVQAELAKAQENLRSRQADLIVVGQRLTVTAANLDQAKASLAETQVKLSAVEDSLRAKTRELEAKQRELSAEQTKRLHFEKLSLEFEQQLRSGNLVLRQGDEIARAVISPFQSPFGIRADILSLLGTASENANKRGVGIGQNGRAVRVVFRQPDGRISDATEAECLDNARDAIWRSRTPVLVQVVCATNTVDGEQALVELLLYANKTIFREGEAIASARIDGRISEGRVLLAVIAFLQGDVADAALGKGIVPVANSDPRQSLGGNPQQQLEKLLAVVGQIKALSAKADVTVYAAADITAAEPLNMDNLRFGMSKVD